DRTSREVNHGSQPSKGDRSTGPPSRYSAHIPRGAPMRRGRSGTQSPEAPMRRGPPEIFTATLSRETQAGRAAARLMFLSESAGALSAGSAQGKTSFGR